jgi:hypothetical protein
VYFKIDGTTLLVTAGPSAPIRAISQTGFAFVSAEVWCASFREVLVCATPSGARLPRVSRVGQDKGDRRLFRWSLADMAQWHEVYRGYAGDVTCLPSAVHVVHRGAGLTFLTTSGAVIREHKVGRFSWGAPSLSSSPSGTLVAWVRLRGDDKKMQVDSVDGSVSHWFAPSVFRYAWLDDQRLLGTQSTELRVLDLVSGTVSRFGRGAQTLMTTALGYPKSLALWPHVGELKVIAGRVWFTGAVVAQGSGERIDGLFSADLEGQTARAEFLTTPTEGQAELIEDLAVADHSSIAAYCVDYANGVQCGQHLRTRGPLASFFRDGWWPLRSCHEPQFEHRTLGLLG